jgi:hypothetical protein
VIFILTFFAQGCCMPLLNFLTPSKDNKTMNLGSRILTSRLLPTALKLLNQRSNYVFQGTSKFVRLCSSSSQGSSPVDNAGGKIVVLSKAEQLKRAVAQYGPTVVVFHVTMTASSFTFFYLMVSSGVDVVSLVEKIPMIGDHMSKSSITAGASTFVMAYAVHMVFAPVRLSITLGSVPFIVRFLRSRGILKATVK